MSACGRALQGWFGRQWSHASNVEVSEPTVLSGGYSGELLGADVTWRADGADHRQGFVVRIEPSSDYQIFLDTNFDKQYRTLEVLNGIASVPIPTVLGFENDASVLGSRFYIMERVQGSPAPIGVPWIEAVKERGADEMRRLWWNGLSAMAAMHRVDVAEHGLEFLAQPERGSDALDEQWDYYREYYDWVRNGVSYAPIEEGFDWLAANKPTDAETAILWGDARRGNALFDDAGVCTALLDFEMVALGPPEADLGWWLYTSELEMRQPLEPWCPGIDETVAVYEDYLGRKIENINYYVVLASLKCATLMIKLQALRGGSVDGHEKHANHEALARTMDRFATS
jgi:aminoglycoside phosphotransferase (APT) family kinase protein